MAIITDQDAFVSCAIVNVFKGSVHKSCSWHIMNKLPQIVGRIPNKEKVIRKIYNVVYESNSTEAFDENWNTMLSKYGLQHND